MKLQSYSKKVTASLVLILLVFGVGAISNNISLVHAVGGGGQYKFITKLGSLGTGNGQFQNVGHIAADSKTGNIFVVDQSNNRIQKFDSNGTFITKWGSQGSGDGQFDYIKEAKRCLATNGYLLIAETTKSMKGRLSKLKEEIEKQGFDIYNQEEKGDFTFIEAREL